MNKKEEILKIIKELDLPITRAEAEAKLDRLSEDELVELLSRYQKAAEYEKFTRVMSEEVDPEEYAKIEEEYEKDKLAVDLEALDEEEAEQAKTDEEEEKWEEGETKKIETSVNAFTESALDLEKKIQEMEDQVAYQQKSAELGAKKS